ncbi:MAG: gamma carbonic anhydrase family protein [Proteobacteria bacterium]|nr:gamma carbonic anhydrase family protein [Pseudomonadota bacterium]
MIREFSGKAPSLGTEVFVAESALVLGDVTLGPQSNIWYGTVLRGDVHSIHVGRGTNIQDNCVVHVTRDVAPTMIGDWVTVGHGAILHGCRIADRVLIGMGAVVLDGVEVGADSLVGAGSLLPPGKSYPPGSLLLGNPARVVRPLRPDEVSGLRQSAADYIDLARQHRHALRPPT